MLDSCVLCKCTCKYACFGKDWEGVPVETMFVGCSVAAHGWFVDMVVCAVFKLEQ